ncbi:Uma2 family endonuclease [Streptomyces telluris]|uniref:Uma2 family endonuclease n=1 Tax=Streptomyces telluris TaxID=2720021 RepID=A0A9X2RR91_9ACTN|nr:Uma2 family endonuclease [Streptomyces telluris]MCQ8773281.1 Uma2 family endonuclease [Streptomyces telluris]NJP81247.1 Uma2 family endonuclease [Streptomyces telluris]
MTPATPAAPDWHQLPEDDFEQLAHHAPEGVKLELIKGKLEVKPVPDGAHGAIIMWMLRQCMQQRPELDLIPEQQLKAESYRKGRAITDATLAPIDHFAASGEWADPAGALMVVEVTSHDSDTDRRDRNEKRDGYAEADIPVYLLVDRQAHTVVVHSEPKDGTYQVCTPYPYGDTVKLPAPVGITLETEKLKDYAD